jgi:hypothetical protein
MNIYRHGDLLIRGIEKLPEGLVKVKSNIVAEGEFTGHNHTIVADKAVVLTDKTGKKYLDLSLLSGRSVTITHPEHKSIEIPCKKYYEVIIEREFDPFENKIRQVKD